MNTCISTGVWVHWRAELFSILALLLSFTIDAHVNAADFFVTSVVREFPMKNGEPVYKDIYINAGTNNGLKKGVYLEALRKMVTFDNINNKVIGNTDIKIARLRVIHCDRNFAIARIVKMHEKENTPLGGFDSIMTGDLIEVSEKQ